MQSPTSTLPRTSSKRLRPYLFGALACSLIALFLSTQSILIRHLDLTFHEWAQSLRGYLILTYLWGALTIGIVVLTSRVGLDGKHWFRCLGIYLGAGILFAAAHFALTIGVHHLLEWLVEERPLPRTPSAHHILSVLHSNLILYTVIASVSLAWSYVRKYQERELRTSQLESKLSEARLAALQSQLEPHFLFNSLNAISALVRSQPETAERMIARLSDLLRAALDSSVEEERTLDSELEFARRYLDIEQMRFGDRMTIEERIAPEVRDALLPTLLLQPLVENAVVHGVAEVSRPCEVILSAKRKGSRLCLLIEDSGPGMDTGAQEPAHRVGLSNAAERLRHLYPEAHELDAGNRDGGGFAVRIEIPYHTRQSTDAAAGGGA